MNRLGRQSTNVEDRRNDPRGAMRLLPNDPNNGDYTFMAPAPSEFGTGFDPSMMGYNAPEWAWNHGSATSGIDLSGLPNRDVALSAQGALARLHLSQEMRRAMLARLLMGK